MAIKLFHPYGGALLGPVGGVPYMQQVDILADTDNILQMITVNG